MNNMKRSYYNVAGIECEKVILRTKMDFSVGNAFKYLYRSNNILPKGNIEEDLNKAIYNLENAISTNSNTFHGRATADKYIKLLDESVFSENIWEAICLLLRGAADNSYIAENVYRSAIDCIKEEIYGEDN